MSDVAISPFQLHVNEDFNTLKNIYRDFYSSNLSYIENLWLKSRNAFIENNPEVFSRLEIKIPPEEMREIFEKYHIIALREMEHSKLLLYCGNRPIYCSATNQEYDNEERKLHAHENFDTCDRDLLMNPCIVMIWPSDINKQCFLKESSIESIEGDAGMSVTTFENLRELKNSLQLLQKILKIEGFAKSTYTFDPSSSLFSRLIIQEYWKEGICNKICSMRTWCSFVSPGWYIKMYHLWSKGVELNDEIKLIETLANSYGLIAEIGEPEVVEGVRAKGGFYHYKKPITRYPIIFRKTLDMP